MGQKPMISRRLFLKICSVLTFFFTFIRIPGVRAGVMTGGSKGLSENNHHANLGCDPDGYSSVFSSKNGTAEQNTQKVIKLMGGIQRIIGINDIVILKPNAQWWNQGMTNTDSMKAFIEMVLQIPGFEGEIIVAENHHFPEDNARGWTTNNRNGKFNYNELVDHFNKKGFTNVSKYHWHDGGPSKQPSWGGAENGGLVNSPTDGDGYAWCPDIEYAAPTGRKTLMNYPVFTSSYSGLKIDLRFGVSKNGVPVDVPIKLINYSVLNHHDQTGVTASIKNYLGIVDMTCGYRGLQPKGYFNFHFVGFSNWPRIFRFAMQRLGWIDTGEYIGGAVGQFMKTVRMADLNIIAGERIGWGDRIDLKMSSRAKIVLASKDPVALDYYGSKHVLLPLTKERDSTGKIAPWHDPDNTQKPFQIFLKSCHDEGIGNLDENFIRLIDYDYAST